VVVGLVTIRPMFSAMGARGEVMGLVEQYMTVWYVGMVFVVVPMVGNSAIRATGDAVSPAAIMLLANGLNLALDPLLIFGLCGLPRMGIRGAAVATVIARGTTMVASLAVLHFRKRMLALSLPRPQELLRGWGQVLYVGLPAAGTVLLGPLTLGVITRMVSSFGREAIAALSAGGRIEMFAMMVIIALAGVMVPLAGQNWGAGLYDRVRRTHRLAERFSLAWGLLCVAGLYALARPLAEAFSDRPAVVRDIMLYLHLVPLGYGAMAVCIVTASGMNGINRPLHAGALGAVRLLVLTVPLAAMGGRYFGLAGIFGAMALANVLGGLAALAWIRRLHAAVLVRR
ncbi:MAG: MATE family efflux transporter, partial [Planctomycetes bacterium]|nr:MATE family efflux transporter [Planctomycetota bacterium]